MPGPAPAHQYGPVGGPHPGSIPHPKGPVRPEEERTWGMLAHIGALVAIITAGGFGWAVPLVILLVYKDRSPYIRHHAAQSLNFQIMLTIGAIISWVLTFVLIGFFTLIALMVVGLVLPILAGVAANRGEWYRYPLTPTMIS